MLFKATGVVLVMSNEKKCKNNVDKFRVDRGLSIIDLASRACVSPSYINKLSNEVVYPSVDRAYRLANVLGVSVYDLFPDQTTVEEVQLTIKRCVL